MYASSQGTLVVREEKPYHHAMRPYGTLGPPYIISKHILLYPTKRVRFGWKLLEKKRLTEQLNKCFPSMYVLSHSVCLLLLSIIQIALQIALMCTNGALWYVASGIWGGVYFVIVAAYGIFLGIFIISFNHLSKAELNQNSQHKELPLIGTRSDNQISYNSG